MTMPNSMQWEVRDTGTTGNVNGGGFNTANANFLTDFTTDSNTANTATPIISSASYNFVPGDVGAWAYVSAGTNWTPGFYVITAVGSNKATLNAAIGAAVQFNSTLGIWSPNTVVGCATTGTPTSGTIGFDFSQQDTAEWSATDFASTGSSTTLTSATGGIRRIITGNVFHQTTTGTGAHGVVGWYEVVSYTDANTVVLDRTPNDGTASVACTGNIGGAARLNGLEDAFYEQVTADSRVWLKSGTYTLSASVSVASTLGTATLPIYTIGYTSIRGDACNGTSRPLIAAGASGFALGQYNYCRNIQFTNTNAAGISIQLGMQLYNCKALNSSTTTTRAAFTLGSGTNTLIIGCEASSQNGNAITGTGGGLRVYGSYLHDCYIGATGGTVGTNIVIGCLFEACETTAIYCSSTATINNLFINNTFYGREAKIGIGVQIDSASSLGNRIWSSIFYGLATAISVLTTRQGSNAGEFNNFFNNTANFTNFYPMRNNLFLDPQFVGAAQITGATATSSGSVLTQSGGDFSTVTDSVDFLHVLSGTGVTVGIYLITSHTSTTLTVNNALGTSSGGDVTYFVTTGHNFAVGPNMAATGFPPFGSSMNIETSSYPDTGAAQRLATGTAFSSTFA